MAGAAKTTPRYVATIEFGTTYCSVAYLLRPDLASEVRPPSLLELDDWRNKRVPNCILFDPSGEKMIAFGYKARDQYACLNPELRLQYNYFEHLMKHLQRQHKENVDRSRRIFAMNGRQFCLVNLIAHVLHHLKDRLLRDLQDNGYTRLKASDFNWVVTVPAFWKSDGGNMMLEAGHMAGLRSDSKPPPIYVATGFRHWNSAEKLLLVWEHEAAAVYCRCEAMMIGRERHYVMRSGTFLLVHIGENTVDITSHAIIGGRIVELAPPAGNFWGGTTVNEEFSVFLQVFVDDPEFSRYIGSGTLKKKTMHKAHLNRLLYTEFEIQKESFGSDDRRDSYIIEFPYSFLRLYEGSLEKKGKALNLKGDLFVQMEDDDSVMRIQKSKMAEFFQPSIDSVADLIKSYLNENKIARTIDTIYWVGGFGGWEYLRNCVEIAIRAQFRRCSYQFALPPDPEFAVIRGATTLLCDPSIAKMMPDSDSQQLQQQLATSFEQTASTSARPTFREEKLVYPRLHAQAPTPPSTRGELRRALDDRLRPYVREAKQTGTELGSGTYGTVVELTSAGEIVAGKKFNVSSHTQSEISDRLYGELILMAEVHHPNIVECKGMCFLDDQNVPVLLMERLMNSLHAHLLNPTNRNIALEKKLIILRGIASGLAYLHSHRPAIIHRDLTAKNVLLDSKLRAKIADFGNARIMDLDPEATPKTSTSLPGTREYMPPEAEGGSAKYDPSLDVFSFGHLSLFTIIQSRVHPLLPSTYTDAKRKLHPRSEVKRREQHMDKAKQRLGEKHSLIVLVKQCLHNYPAQRPQTAELEIRIQDILDSTSAAEQPTRLQINPGRPTLPELLRFTRADKRKINIAEEIGDEYKMFGTFLLEDETGQKVRSMEIKHHFDPSKINIQILEEWIKGKGKQPLTWGTLVEVLREIELTTLANDISTVKWNMKSIV